MLGLHQLRVNNDVIKLNINIEPQVKGMSNMNAYAANSTQKSF